MHALAFGIVMLGLAAAVFAIGAFADPEVVRRRGIWRVLAAGSLVLSLSMLLLLVYAPRRACESLGGDWRQSHRQMEYALFETTQPGSCLNESGGNGDNSGSDSKPGNQGRDQNDSSPDPVPSPEVSPLP